jgi:hypothetical protein
MLFIHHQELLFHDMFVYKSGLEREPRHYKNVPRETHKGSRNPNTL